MYSVVGISDRSDMTSAVYHGRKALDQTKNFTCISERKAISLLITTP